MPKLIDRTGQRYGHLTVIERAGNSKSGHTMWLCECDCGKHVKVESYNLATGHTKSCGCLSKECTRERFMTHGYTTDGRHPLYRVWQSMKDRCLNPKCTRYEYYGGRGIKICDRWLEFKTFLVDIEDLYKPGLTIDRIDNNGDYEPGNIRWSTSSEQNSNKRMQRNNTSGKTGVCWHRQKGKWSAYIGINGEQKRLGYFADKQDAIDARKAAEEDKAWDKKASATKPTAKKKRQRKMKEVDPAPKKAVKKKKDKK